MAQYIRVPIDQDIQQLFEHTHQVSQIVYRNQRVIDIDYNTLHNRVVVRDNDNWFYLTSPDLPNMTMNEVLIGLGYGGEQAVVTWADQNQEDIVLNSPVFQAPLNQMALYAPNQPIPDVHWAGPFPEQEEHELVHENNQHDDQDDPSDDNSTITYPSSDEIDDSEDPSSDEDNQ